MSDNRLPITRNNKFFHEEDFDLDIQMGMEYLHGDINMKFVLFRVDRMRTEKDEVYAETGKDEIKFLPPVEFNGLARVDEPKNVSYNKGINRKLEPGNLLVSVYIKHLDELNIDIRYGDYIGYPESETKLRYYTVINDGKVTSDNKHMHFGYKPGHRTIICTIAEDGEFRGV